MISEDVLSEVSARTPTGYKLKQLVSFSYPYREITIKATVCRNPDASMTKVYRQILLTIDDGFRQKDTLFEFLGISPTDEFMIQELRFLFEKELLEHTTDGYVLTSLGQQFINEATGLTIEETEDYRFLIDGITMEIVSAKHIYTYRERQEKFLATRNFHRKKDAVMLEDLMESIVDCYKQDVAHAAYLTGQEIPEIQKDRDVWGSYLLAVYSQPDLTETEDLKLEVLLPKSLNKEGDLTRLFNEDLSLHLHLI
jgi:hypothetical protein